VLEWRVHSPLQAAVLDWGNVGEGCGGKWSRKGRGHGGCLIGSECVSAGESTVNEKEKAILLARKVEVRRNARGGSLPLNGGFVPGAREEVGEEN